MSMRSTTLNLSTVLLRHARAKKNGLCAGGSNQPVCIARGKFTEAQFETLTEWMDGRWRTAMSIWMVSIIARIIRG